MTPVHGSRTGRNQNRFMVLFLRQEPCNQNRYRFTAGSPRFTGELGRHLRHKGAATTSPQRLGSRETESLGHGDIAGTGTL
jgi:hypothetical protein